MHDNDPFEKQVNNKAPFKTHVLGDVDKQQWPDRIDYIASRLVDGQYTYGIGSGGSEYIGNGYTLNRTAKDLYLEGIAALAGDPFRKTALPDSFNIGELLVEFAGLKQGLEDVDKGDIPPGELLARVLTRRVQRGTTGDASHIAEELRADIETPRELVTQLTTVPEIASTVEESVPETDNPRSLRDELAELNLTTMLWEHQLESLARWLDHGMNGYVDMATATGKTVLGLAAVAWSVDPGSLHPNDRLQLHETLGEEMPNRPTRRPNRVLIVTTDELLGIQWANLFEEHCNTPSAFTKVGDRGITLPWGTIETRSAGALEDLDPRDYRLAIFDEVHNYTSRSGWGEQLERFVDSSCPVLALTGSVTRQLRQLSEQTKEAFPLIYQYTHRRALEEGVIPDFEWDLAFTETADTEALEAFASTAESFHRLVTYQDRQYHVSHDALAAETDLTDDECDAIAGSYQSGSAVESGLRSPTDGNTAPTEWMETLASRIGNRTIYRLNLKPDLEQILDLAEEALADNRPVLVLTQSYPQAEDLAERLEEDDDVVVEYLTSGQDATTQDEIISRFDEHQTAKKVLLGPGKRIGQGNDIHDVEVGINVSQFGSGVNLTLVQRLGRLLRDPENKDSVSFHHIIGLPPADATIDPDAESFVRTTAEFFGQVLGPDHEGILKPPGVSVERASVEETVLKLEASGAPHVLADETASIVEQAYAAAIEEADGNSTTVDSDWFDATVGESSPQVKAPDDEATVSHEKGTQTTLDGAVVAGGDESTEGSEDAVGPSHSPLVEHFEAFRSLDFIHQGIRQGSDVELDDADPFAKWMADVQALARGEGFGEQQESYERQVRSEDVNLDAYREEFGNGMRVTEYESVDVIEPPAALRAFPIDDFADLSTRIVPVAPLAETAVPVIVETEEELERARALLRQFDSEPSVYDDADTDTESEETANSDTSDISSDRVQKTGQGDNATAETNDEVPVERVRGVSTTVADTLRSAGYETMGDLQKATDEELENLAGVSADRIKLIRATVGSE